MSEEEDLEGHERVVTGLLDLQAKLRGEEASDQAGSRWKPTGIGENLVEIPEPEDLVEIPEASTDEASADPVPGEGPVRTDTGIQVLVTPDPHEAAERERFAPVTTLPTAGVAEDRLAAFSDRLVRLEREVSSVTGRVELVAGPRDERFVDIEQRLIREVASQREDLLHEIDERFDRLETTLLGALHDARTEAADPSDDEPA